MSQIELHPQKNQKIDLLTKFEIFCDNKFNHWNQYMTDHVFADLYTVDKHKYGILIFHDLVNFVSTVEKISIKDILTQFSSFVNTYY